MGGGRQIPLYPAAEAHQLGSALLKAQIDSLAWQRARKCQGVALPVRREICARGRPRRSGCSSMGSIVGSAAATACLASECLALSPHVGGRGRSRTYRGRVRRPPTGLKPARPTGSGTLPSGRIATFLDPVNDRLALGFEKPLGGEAAGARQAIPAFAPWASQLAAACAAGPKARRWRSSAETRGMSAQNGSGPDAGGSGAMLTRPPNLEKLFAESAGRATTETFVAALGITDAASPLASSGNCGGSRSLPKSPTQ